MTLCAAQHVPTAPVPCLPVVTVQWAHGGVQEPCRPAKLKQAGIIFAITTGRQQGHCGPLPLQDLQDPPEQIATIGDMPNDVLMFAHAGLSIAMGNASPEIQQAARRVTTSNEDEGFANVVERFVLP
jgi:hypothetical protein